MNAWIRRALCAVGITGGIVLLGLGLAEAASADGDGPVTSGESGILSGNQTGADVKAPINLSGNQITVIGQHNHATSAGASSTGTGGGSASGSPTTTGEHGIGSGNQTAVGVQAPINVSGNQVTVIGQHNDVKSASGSSTSGGGAASSSPTTSGEHGIVSGNQTAVGVQAPINASGNQVTVIGQDNTVKSLSGSATPGGGSAGTSTTSGAGGLIAGNQTALGIALPINISGNQVTVIGQHNTNTAAAGSSTAAGGGSGATTGGATTSGENGAISGNQTGIAIAAPVAATGNQVTVIGQGNTNTSAGGATTGGGQTGGTTGGQTTTGEGGVGSGNQTPISVQVPVDTSGNQVTVIGQDNTDTSTSGSSTGGGTTPGSTEPPTDGGVVSPPAGGGNGTSGAPSPGATVLPNTGAPTGLVGLGLLALAMLLAGGALLRREAILG
jgi:LPXTG-motif cell wall-anchored protein